jgi:hypothetical protein
MPRWAGQVDPLGLAELVASRGLGCRELKEVRVYRGRPDVNHEPRTYWANVRQSDAQVSAGDGKVTVVTRTLRYPPDWPETHAQEKGIDVALAVDFVHREGPCVRWQPGRGPAAMARGSASVPRTSGAIG